MGSVSESFGVKGFRGFCGQRVKGSNVGFSLLRWGFATLKEAQGG